MNYNVIVIVRLVVGLFTSKDTREVGSFEDFIWNIWSYSSWVGALVEVINICFWSKENAFISSHFFTSTFHCVIRELKVEIINW